MCVCVGGGGGGGDGGTVVVVMVVVLWWAGVGSQLSHQSQGDSILLLYYFS